MEDVLCDVLLTCDVWMVRCDRIDVNYHVNKESKYKPKSAFHDESEQNIAIKSVVMASSSL